MKRKFNLKIFVVSLVAVYFFAFVGSLFTSGNVNSAWYDSIKPSITPPNFVFPIVWNVLFILIAFSLYFAWTKARNKKTSHKITWVFGINLVLNALWSFLFFSLKMPVIAFAELVVLWISIFAMMAVTWKIEKVSSYLLIPYLLWVTFAGVLNYLIAFSNIY
jgi:benzodiazapine receptor